MEFTLCYWFWSIITVVLSFFYSFIVVQLLFFWFLTWFWLFLYLCCFLDHLSSRSKIIKCFLSGRALFLPTCTDLSWAAATMVLHGSQQLAPVPFSLLVLLPVSGWCSCSDLAACCFKDPLPRAYSACCSAMLLHALEINFFVPLGLFTTSLIWSVIATIRSLISLFISLFVVAGFRLSPFRWLSQDRVFDGYLVVFAFSLLFARASRSALKLRLFGLTAMLLFLSQLPLLFWRVLLLSLRQLLSWQPLLLLSFDCFLFRCKVLINFSATSVSTLDAWLCIVKLISRTTSLLSLPNSILV